MRLLLPLSLLLLGTGPDPAAVEVDTTATFAGVKGIALLDPITHGPLSAVLFYPTASPPGDGAEMGPYRVMATPGAPPAGHSWPLVVISHGHAGSMLGHHDLAEALAEHGIAAIAVEHAGDSYRDQSGFGTDRVLLGRAAQASAAIDAALAETGQGERIDPSRIGAMGFSAGGYTALLLAGARPDFGRVSGYCQRHPADREMCGVHVRHVLPLTRKRGNLDHRPLRSRIRCIDPVWQT